MRGCAGDKGLTLLELVVVLSLFALVAVMGLQALSGTMRAQDRLIEVDDRTAELARALTIMRSDLRAAAAREFMPPGADEAEPAFMDLSANEGVVTFSITGQQVLPGVQAAGQSRVIWRYDRDEGYLTRQVWPVLRPAAVRALSPEVVMLEGIIDLDVRSYTGESEGWVRDYGLDQDIEVPPLPQAVDIRLESRLYGALRVVVSF
ncbi:Type II secretion system protein J precursor [Roseovarius litorisediminis]|uniref:Type II secretion system protein J n=1 Tax=Roseovarius litorisediminis TaxID=1312363 RepID=A0A1Y5SVT9_9RHOB|nr:type II secretion system minor pseudopilin GspJ [Roseovarius litorisediminis]SLN47734.1 Type II secretion system protein J precursor [Roseovarius litorisediminis]